MPRFYCPTPLASDALLELPAGAARHVQVLRLQPGDTITLFNGGHGGTAEVDRLVHPSGEFEATITHMGRSDVQVRVGAYHAVEREAGLSVHLALGMPANDRMDWLVEKATELGVHSVQPLMCERSVLRLNGERADKKVAHWQSVAIAASEQCGGTRVPVVHPVMALGRWLQGQSTQPSVGTARFLLSLRPGTQSLQAATQQHAIFLSGPEGGLSPDEEAAAMAAGFSPVSLGARVLRAETAAISALAALTLLA
jgi:16S rRNA (uracil1498-N3)-methyltransferase